MNLLDQLNNQQLEAVTLPDVSALILAGAGSGKTKVLITRIAHLFQTKKILTSRILAVTFTNKASKEMIHRLKTSGIPTNDLWIGTFHSLCNKMLKNSYQEAGLPKNFYILDSQEQLTFIKRIMRNNGYDYKTIGAEIIQSYINDKKENGIRSYKITTPSTENEIYKLYEAGCNTEGCVDFSELLLRCYELLLNNEVIAQHYQKKFQYVLVDEFQDTNNLQYKWLKKISEFYKCVFAVGDDDQSIYSFRGAQPENMQQFKNDFAPVKVIKLEQNYRSLGNILKAANSVISYNTNRQGKNLWTSRDEGHQIQLYDAFNDQEEAGFIAEEIKKLRRTQISFKEIAVLYRTNAQSRNIEKVFTAHGIPFIIYGGFRFFDRQEIKHAMAYLRLVANKNDNMAFLRVINFPNRGIGDGTVKKIEEISKIQNISLWDATEKITGKIKEKIQVFKKIIDDLTNYCAEQKLSKMVELVIIHSGLEELYKLDKKEGFERLDNLYELISAAELYTIENKNHTLEDFLSFTSLESDVDSKKRDPNADQVKLMTVHASKGLEFQAVFLSGVEEGIFPHTNSLEDNNKLEEERRLMYVGITRSKEILYITTAEERMIHGTMRIAFKSRFLKEIPTELIYSIK